MTKDLEQSGENVLEGEHCICCTDDISNDGVLSRVNELDELNDNLKEQDDLEDLDDLDDNIIELDDLDDNLKELDDLVDNLTELDVLLNRAEKEQADYLAKLKHWDTRFLDLAKLVSSWSKDPSSKVGAVIVNEKNHVVSLGFNGLPMGVEDTDERLSNRELKYDLIVHAEQNAILCSPQSVAGCRIYVYPYLPCSRCAGAIIQSGIKEVVVEDLPIPDRWVKNFNLAKEILQEAGVNVRQITGEENG